MNKLLVICGPTATGKTALGIRLAKKSSGEIISADSRQVYKGMDVGTGKEISKIKYQKSKIQVKNQKFVIYKIDNIPIWLWDVVEPDYQFSVADYVKCADLAIDDILSRKKLPILVGGTGFYIKALVDGIKTIGVEPDWELRKKFSNFQITKLSKLLRRLGPEKWKRMNESDRKNPRRLIRAIEVSLAKKPKTLTPKPYPLNPLFIGLTAPNKVLYQRIDERVEQRVKQGVVDEIEKLLAQGYSWENSVLGETIGYKEWHPYFEWLNGQMVKWLKIEDEIIQKWKYDEHAYARRQMTWFKKNGRIFWFDITKEGFEKEIEKKVKNWLKN